MHLEIMMGGPACYHSDVYSQMLSLYVFYVIVVIHYYLLPAAKGSGREIIKRHLCVYACESPSVHHIFT